MLNIFESNRVQVLFLIPILVFGYLFINQFTQYYADQNNYNIGFWSENLKINPFIATICSGILISINAIGINLIYNANQFQNKNTYFSSILYVVLMSFFHSFYHIDGLLIAHTFIILMLFQFFKLNQNENGMTAVFNGSFFAGVAASFHPPLIMILPIIFILIWTIRPFIFRETLLVLIGFGIPLIYAFVFMWYYGVRIEYKSLTMTTNYENKQADFLLTAIFFSSLFVMSLLTVQSKMKLSSNRLKKLSRILWWMMFVGIGFGIFDLISFGQIEKFSILMIPFSFFLTFSFLHKTYGAVATLLFYLTFGYSWIKFFT